jgi:hypothetical protein
MYKKIIVILLIVLMAVSMAACGSGGDNKDTTAEGSTTAPVTTAEETTAAGGLEGTLNDIVDDIYAKMTNFNFELMPTTTVDLTKTDAVKGYLGLTGAEGIEEAVFSEPTMSPSAYSLCLIRVKDGTDIEKMKNDIAQGVDMFKWVCVGAEKVIVNNSGNVILLIMTNKDTCDNVYNAFVTVAANNVGEEVIRNASAN